jgi:hypothetical protein
MSHRVLSAWVLAAVTVLVEPSVVVAQRPDTIVRNVAPRYAGVGTFVQEQSIGVTLGANEYMFAQIADVLPAANGALYVVDRGDMELRVYDAAGRYVRTMARRGQGPGEFTAASGLAELRDGRLLLYDSGNRRINVYSSTGATLAHWPLASSVPGGSRALVVDTSGFVYYRRAHLRQYPSRNMGGRPITSSQGFWLRLRPSDGAVLDSVAEPDRGPPQEPFFASSGRGWRQMATPFRPIEIAAMSPTGHLVAGVSTSYAFEILPPRGPVLSIRRDVAADPVSPAERRSARTYVESRMREVNPAWTWPRDIPSTKPVYRGVIIGLDGRIWLVIREPTSPPRAPSARRGATGGSAMGVTPPEMGGVDGEQAGIYDVFEPDGSLIGRVQAPDKVFPLTMRGDHVWAVARDEDDVQFVRRYRVVWR